MCRTKAGGQGQTQGASDGLLQGPQVPGPRGQRGESGRSLMFRMHQSGCGAECVV